MRYYKEKICLCLKTGYYKAKFVCWNNFKFLNFSKLVNYFWVKNYKNKTIISFIQ